MAVRTKLKSRKMRNGTKNVIKYLLKTNKLPNRKDRTTDLTIFAIT